MAQRIHLLAGLLATLIIAGFFSVSLYSELLGSTETIAAVKACAVEACPLLRYVYGICS